MQLANLLTLNAEVKPDAGQAREITYNKPVTDPVRRDYYKALLNAAMHNYPDIRQGLQHTGIGIYQKDDRWYLVDHTDKAFIPFEQLLDSEAYAQMMQAFAASGEVSAEIARQHVYIPAPVIAPSSDDEANHGRKRKRKKHQ